MLRGKQLTKPPVGSGRERGTYWCLQATRLPGFPTFPFCILNAAETRCISKSHDRNFLSLGNLQPDRSQSQSSRGLESLLGVGIYGGEACMSADTVSGTLYNLEIPVPFPSAVRLQNQLSPRYGNSPGISCEKDEAWCQPRRNCLQGWDVTQFQWFVTFRKRMEQRLMERPHPDQTA